MNANAHISSVYDAEVTINVGGGIGNTLRYCTECGLVAPTFGGYHIDTHFEDLCHGEGPKHIWHLVSAIYIDLAKDDER
jgi:hypothetical protein